MSEWLLMQSNVVVTVVIFVLLLCGALGFPPEDFTLILSGVVLNHGKSDIKTIFIVCYLGTILGDIFIYGVGRWFGTALFQKEWFKRRVKSARIRRVRIKLERKSFIMIFFARHLFYLRTITFLTCGAVRLTFIRFLVADCVSALVSVPIMLWLGFIASENYEMVMHYLGKAKTLSLFLVIGIAAITVYLLYGKQQNKGEQPPLEEEPSNDSVPR